MKSRNKLAVLTGLWAFFVALEGVSSFIRFVYSRKMNTAFKIVSGIVHGVKGITMIILAISNVLLFIKQIDEGKEKITNALSSVKS